MHPFVHCSVGYNGKAMKAKGPSIDKWVKKMCTYIFWQWGEKADLFFCCLTLINLFFYIKCPILHSGGLVKEMESSLSLWSCGSWWGYKFNHGKCYERDSESHGNTRRVKRCPEAVMSKWCICMYTHIYI